MDDADAHSQPDQKELESRPPLQADLVALCRELNARGAHYVVIGGFAIIAAGLPRSWRGRFAYLLRDGAG